MVSQTEIRLSPRKRGFHLITNELIQALPHLPTTGILELFIQHTSAGLTINENADPDVRVDFETIFNRLVPEHQAGLKHTIEGSDDMPAHIKASLVGFSVRIPISQGRLNLGSWQGIYLCEFRNYGGPRKIVASIIS